MAFVNEIQVRVRYAETDQMGVVYHANYLVWMEMGRVELCRSIGIRYRDMEQEDGVLLAVAEVSCRYLSPARFDDEVLVKTEVTRSSSRLLDFGYEMTARQTGRKLATGLSTHIFCDSEMRPCRLPAKYWKAFGIS
jgi:acyl-CoA thioester hydrolase